jgi:hypothetical protein
MDFQQKYLKYKNKYTKLKNYKNSIKFGGSSVVDVDVHNDADPHEGQMINWFLANNIPIPYGLRDRQTKQSHPEARFHAMIPSRSKDNISQEEKNDYLIVGNALKTIWSRRPPQWWIDGVRQNPALNAQYEIFPNPDIIIQN